jgi:hypothetical protein
VYPIFSSTKVWQKARRELVRVEAVFWAFWMSSEAWPEGILFGHARSIITQREDLSGIDGDRRRLKRLCVVPRHPLIWIFLQLLRVALQLGEIVERIGVARRG